VESHIQLQRKNVALRARRGSDTVNDKQMVSLKGP